MKKNNKIISAYANKRIKISSTLAVRLWTKLMRKGTVKNERSSRTMMSSGNTE
jgi:hypothetical protein